MRFYQIPGLKDVAFEILVHDFSPDSEKPHELFVRWWNVVSCHPANSVIGLDKLKLTAEQWANKYEVSPAW